MECIPQMKPQPFFRLMSGARAFITNRLHGYESYIWACQGSTLKFVSDRQADQARGYPDDRIDPVGRIRALRRCQVEP